VRIHKFTSTDAFVAIDLDDAEASSGPVRWARKVLQGGAKDLARSQTYTFAVLGMKRGGASAGISADGPDRDAAIAAFVTEAGELVADGTYLPDAAKGVGESDLAPLREADERDTARLADPAPSFVDRSEGLGAAVTAHHAASGLSGKSIAIEGFGANGGALAAAAIERGGTVTSIATTTGAVTNPAGFAAADLADAWAQHGVDMVNEMGDVGHPMSIFGSGADVWFVGSKMGVVDHEVAAQIGEANAVVACGRLPLTARALAVLRRGRVAVPADFVSLAGSTLALWGDPNRTEAEILAGVNEDLGDMTAEFKGHEDGAFLAACFEAESFLSSWQETLPFGRPLAP
jgi:glutamate dehydrogenase/leucine dehydrogenase